MFLNCKSNLTLDFSAAGLNIWNSVPRWSTADQTRYRPSNNSREVIRLPERSKIWKGSNQNDGRRGDADSKPELSSSVEAWAAPAPIHRTQATLPPRLLRLQVQGASRTFASAWCRCSQGRPGASAPDGPTAEHPHAAAALRWAMGGHLRATHRRSP
jgi:hypothetical protein